MKIAALIAAAVATGLLVGGVRLLVATHGFATSAEYALGKFSSVAYASRGDDPTGLGIYVPSLLLIGAGLFFAKFAYNLWMAGRQTGPDKSVRRGKSSRSR